MNRRDAIEKIEWSLSEGSTTPSGFQALPRDEYISEQSRILLECIIDPVEAKITSAQFEEYAYQDFVSQRVWAIAHRNNEWLLSPDGVREFALGFGDSPTNINMLGFASSDALAEWLG